MGWCIWIHEGTPTGLFVCLPVHCAHKVTTCHYYLDFWEVNFILCLCQLKVLLEAAQGRIDKSHS